MHGLLMDDIVKMRRNLCGKFYKTSNQNRHRDKYFRKKQRGSINYLGQRNGHRICVSGNEEDGHSWFLELEDQHYW